MPRGKVIPVLAALAAIILGSGCVKRTIRITSDPTGALVWLNDREVGRTPLDVEFLHYGTYDVRLERAGYESLATAGEANPPWWDLPGPDLVAEVLPFRAHSVVDWHFELEPRPSDPAHERAMLIDRAQEIRDRLPPPPPDADTDTDADTDAGTDADTDAGTVAGTDAGTVAGTDTDAVADAESPPPSP